MSLQKQLERNRKNAHLVIALLFAAYSFALSMAVWALLTDRLMVLFISLLLGLVSVVCAIHESNKADEIHELIKRLEQ
jgi:hypothetical protein